MGTRLSNCGRCNVQRSPLEEILKLNEEVRLARGAHFNRVDEEVPAIAAADSLEPARQFARYSAGTIESFSVEQIQQTMSEDQSEGLGKRGSHGGEGAVDVDLQHVSKNQRIDEDANFVPPILLLEKEGVEPETTLPEELSMTITAEDLHDGTAPTPTIQLGMDVKKASIFNRRKSIKEDVTITTATAANVHGTSPILRLGSADSSGRPPHPGRASLFERRSSGKMVTTGSEAEIDRANAPRSSAQAGGDETMSDNAVAMDATDGAGALGS